ncbi:MAG: hypothetical protein R3B74_13210 [Nitrospirales bacterium]|nr:hypothetical protein [Nitrospirales bacterium]
MKYAMRAIGLCWCLLGLIACGEPSKVLYKPRLSALESVINCDPPV